MEMATLFRLLGKMFQSVVTHAYQLRLTSNNIRTATRFSSGYTRVRRTQPRAFGLRYLETQAFEGFLTSKILGSDAGNLVAGPVNAHLGIKTVG